MSNAFEFQNVSKRFGKTIAIDDVTYAAPRQSVIGLIGKNGSGKTTLLRHVTGLYLPTSGRCTTSGVPAGDLGKDELSRIGVVNQHDTFLPWMRARQLLRYVSSFYERWDHELERQLIRTLEIDTETRVGAMSPGNVQKLALVVATCHRPELLLLDEPLSDLDPIARQDVLTMLLDYFREGEATIVISSHMLHDIERIADRIVCMDGGRIVADAPLDELKEGYAEWWVTSGAGALPAKFPEAFILSASGNRFQARVFVRDPEAHAAEFRERYTAAIEVRPLGLEAVFRLIAHGGRTGSFASSSGVVAPANDGSRR
ncbi:MAG: ABC transporter ATP-binding protein [Gemmatimonadota bacterium]|nr:ABC transporter ATP-binding protein [Gemmatimonadota bacterium]